MSPYEKVSPFNAFMKFLDGEREAVARVAEVQVKRKNNDQRINERRRQYGYHVTKQASSSITSALIPRIERTLLLTLQRNARNFRNYLLAARTGNTNS